MTELKKRNSSVELFRIIATFLVLIVHFNGWFVNMHEYLRGFTLPDLSQAFIEMLSCICVNCFIIITGWYGLKLKWKHIISIWSVLFFIYVPLYLFEAILMNKFSWLHLLFKIVAIPCENYYIQCYLMLLFLSPILNKFIAESKNLLSYTIVFWIIEIIFDWILQNPYLGFKRGFGITHFMLLYLLCQTLHNNRKRLLSWFNTKLGIGIYIFGVLLLWCMYFKFPLKFVIAYSNPINIIMSLSLFLIFERKIFYNKFINWIGGSTLAVYIIHISSPIVTYLMYWDQYVRNSFPYFSYLLIILLSIFIIFIIGILYDKIRIICLKKLNLYITSILDTATNHIISKLQNMK